MLLLCVLFWFNFSYSSHDQLSLNSVGSIPFGEKKSESSEIMTRLVVIKPQEQSEEEFVRDITKLIADAEESKGEKSAELNFLNNETAEAIVSQDGVKDIQAKFLKFYSSHNQDVNVIPMPSVGAAAAASSSDDNMELNLKSFSEDHLGRLALSRREVSKIPEASGWVKEFYDNYSGRLLQQYREIFDNFNSKYMSFILQYLSKFVHVENEEESDLPPKNVQLLNLFKVFHKDVLCQTQSTLIKKLSQDIASGKISFDYEFSKEMYLESVFFVLSEHTLPLQHNKAGSVIFSQENIIDLGKKIVDNFIAKHEQRLQLIDEWKAQRIAKYLSMCCISYSEFEALSFGEQNLAVFIASILLDSTIGKEHFKNPKEDHKRLFDDLLQLIKLLRKHIKIHKQGSYQTDDLPLTEEIFNKYKDFVLLATIKALSCKEIKPLRCTIDNNGKIIWNKNVLRSVLQGVLRVPSGEDYSSQEFLDSMDKRYKQSQEQKAMQDQQKQKQKEEELLKIRAQHQEADRKRAAVETERNEQAAKKEAAGKKRREKEEEAARIAAEKAEQDRLAVIAKAEREQEKNRRLTEEKKKQEAERERLRLLRIQLEGKLESNIDGAFKDYEKIVREILEKSSKSIQLIATCGAEEQDKRKDLINNELNESKIIEDTKSDILRLLRIQLEDQRTQVLKNLEKTADELLAEHNNRLEQIKRKSLNEFIRKFCSKIRMKDGRFMHNPYPPTVQN
jgi:hypothetical protein